jgi:eukaryotic translation initiation factor 2C
MSVADYFQKVYNVSLSYPDAPVLWVGPTNKKTYLPIELCDIPPGQAYIRKLDGDQTANMITFTAEKPQKKLEAIEAGLKTMLGAEGDEITNEYLRDFGIEIDGRPLVVNGRFLPTPSVSYSPKSRAPKLSPQEASGGSWNLMNKQMTAGAALKSWAIVNFAPHMTRGDDIPKFVEVFNKVRSTLQSFFFLAFLSSCSSTLASPLLLC